MARRLEITLSEERWAELDRVRGFEPRASFVKRALEKALGEQATTAETPKAKGVPGASGVAAPAPPRAPEGNLCDPVEVERDRKRQATAVPSAVRASSLVKQGVRPIPKKGT